ncbi:hypothetical protein ABH924_003262 [Arthrobacter sp. GAS37]|uniref:hypothetical protein n=1 Tax=Arthrobacter sp. GAS37 TaxID=3156261 RepID=UPI003834CCB4
MSSAPSYISKEELDRFTPEALSILEGLGEHVRGFHDGPYLLPKDSPLPDWFLSAVDGVKNQGVETEWPQFARYWDPVDWLCLVRDHPDHIRFRGPGGQDLLSGLIQWCVAEGLTPVFDVALYIDEDAAIAIELWTLVFDDRVAPIQQSRIHVTFTSHGYTGYWFGGSYQLTSGW